MERKYDIADVDTDSVRIHICVTANDDGSLRIDDWSMGHVADLMYGDGADVERWISIRPESVRKLSVKIFRDWVDEPATKVCEYLAKRYRGNTDAIGDIERFLKSLDVPYDLGRWV